MTKRLNITFLASTLLALASAPLLANSNQCSTWQNSPSSIDSSSLKFVTKKDIEQCMNSCKRMPLSSSNTDLTPGLCMQHVSNIAYLAQASKDVPNVSASNTLSTQKTEQNNTPQAAKQTNTPESHPNNTKAMSSSSPPQSAKKLKKNINIIHWI